MKHIIHIAAAIFSFAAAANAQGIQITFEDDVQYEVSTYDVWEESPFRTGKLEGQAMLAPNLRADEANPSATVLAFHRSQYGSHIYGARVDLDTPVAFTAQPRYLHVMILKPHAGDAALVVLGKRSDRVAQDSETVQVVLRSLNEVKAGEWCDAVFELRGNDKAMMHSLVIAPDTERNPASHGSYVACIDNLLLDDDPRPRSASVPYSLSFPVDAVANGFPATFSCIAFKGDKGAEGAFHVGDGNESVYFNMTTAKALPVMPGEEITVSFGEMGSMLACCMFADWDNDGLFGDQPCMSDGVMSFTVPDSLQAGVYRLRCKVSEHSGNLSSPYDASTADAGAGEKIIDFLVNVPGTQANVSFVARMCTVSSPSGGPAPVVAEYGKDFSFVVDMDSDYLLTGVEVKHGHNLSGAEFVNGNRQWIAETIELQGSGLVTIPASMIDGDVSVNILFVNK